MQSTAPLKSPGDTFTEPGLAGNKGERNSNSNCSQQNEQADWLNAGQMVTIKNNTALLPKWGVETNCQR